METTEQQTKKCPFCAEIIQAEAIKCRFCNEFLTPDNLPDKPEPGTFPYKVRPSAWAIANFAFGGLLLLALACAMIIYPFDTLLQRYPNMNLSQNQVLGIDHYAHLGGLCMILVVLLGMLLKLAKLKSISYEITADRIEWARGIFSRKIDNMDMFRVIDLKLHRSLLDCIVGIGTVTLITKDQSDPKFSFRKIRRPRKLYDILKKTALDADRKQGVMHIE